MVVPNASGGTGSLHTIDEMLRRTWRYSLLSQGAYVVMVLILARRPPSGAAPSFALPVWAAYILAVYAAGVAPFSLVSHRRLLTRQKLTAASADGETAVLERVKAGFFIPWGLTMFCSLVGLGAGLINRGGVLAYVLLALGCVFTAVVRPRAGIVDALLAQSRGTEAEPDPSTRA